MTRSCADQPRPPRVRVAAYVIRHTPTGAQLLVFDHIGIPAAGTQVPAGGVAPGETLEDAVLREVHEETGLTGVVLVSAVGTDDSPHPETGQPRRTTYFQLQAAADAPDSWDHIVTGTGQDTNLHFACRFAPLPLSTELADRQDALLARTQGVFR